ncbi:MAG: hypothetical protein LUG25_03545 [Oscillospiraceae bacterium]|nr:hypothetical protein [Oscillospiraceae bacterium]
MTVLFWVIWILAFAGIGALLVGAGYYIGARERMNIQFWHRQNTIQSLNKVIRDYYTGNEKDACSEEEES